MPTTAVHFGPDVRFIGGMESVLRILVDHSVGADEIRAIPTWVRGSHVRSARLALRAIRRILRLPRSTIVHVHLSEGGSFVREGLLVLTARLRGCTTAVSIHGPNFPAFAARWSRLVRGVLGRAHIVTCLTPADQTICAELAPRALVRLVPNPTPVDEDAAPADSTSEVVLFAGEIGRRKGADVLRSAWDQVAEQRPQAHCLMIGPYTELEVAPGERMEIRPSVSREDLKPLLRNARVVALPSRAEALPMILTEAMAAGRPFVGTPVGSVPSLESGGSLVPVEDPDALAGALISYLSDPGLARDVGERGRSYCRSTRGIDHVDSVLRELYREAHSNH